MPSVYAAVMYSLASHIAVVGASVTTYSASTAEPTMSPRRRYEGCRSADRRRKPSCQSASNGDGHENRRSPSTSSAAARSDPAAREIDVSDEDERRPRRRAARARARPGSAHGASHRCPLEASGRARRDRGDQLLARRQIEQGVRSGRPRPSTRASARGVGHPPRLVDDERVAVLAVVQRERDRPASRAFVAHERRRVGVATR